jgi:hypothetical protein
MVAGIGTTAARLRKNCLGRVVAALRSARCRASGSIWLSKVQHVFDQLRQRIGHRQLQRGSPICDRPHALDQI